MTTRQEHLDCCTEFQDAKQEGTDNEGYGKLIRIKNGLYVTGDGLPAIIFCPWCGARLEKP